MMINLWAISNGLLIIVQVTCASESSTLISWRKSALEQLNLIQNELLDLKPNSEKGGSTEDASKHWDPDELFEGDMVLTDEQIGVLLGDAKEQLKRKRIGQHSKERRRRVVLEEGVHKWEQFPIPVIINTESGVNASVIKEALHLWEKQACVRFKELPTAEHGKPYIEFKISKGCSSNVGRVSAHRQKISLDSNCSSVGMVAHLIGHSLGLFHEQVRHDRDEYVNILTDNIIAGYTNQFTKRTQRVLETHSVPYDYGSLMHFNQTHFSRNGYNTIEPVDPNYRYTIGQRMKPTFSDAKKINFAYCKDACQTTLKCEYDGYADPRDCSRCRCPEVFDGYFCERARRTTSTICGDDLDLTCSEKKQIIELNGVGECHYVIKSATGRPVELDVVKFEFENQIPCEHDYLEVRYGKHLSVTGARFCVSKPDRIVSVTDTMAVTYRGSHNSYLTLSFRCSSPFQISTDGSEGTGSTVVPSASSFRTDNENGPTEVREKKIQTANASFISTEMIIKTIGGTPKSTKKNEQPRVIIPELLVDEHLPSSTGELPEIDKQDEWSSWSICSANCGGCGTQQRNKTRPYLTIQKRYCNTRICEGSGCCLPFTYVYRGTCLRPFNSCETNTICEKKFTTTRPIATTTMTTTQPPCISTTNAKCEIVKEEKQEKLLIYEGQSSSGAAVSAVSQSIDAQSDKVTISGSSNDDDNDDSNNNSSISIDKSDSNSTNNKYILNRRIRYELLKQFPSLKKRMQETDRHVPAEKSETDLGRKLLEEEGEGTFADNLDDEMGEGSGENGTVGEMGNRKTVYFYDETLHL